MKRPLGEKTYPITADGLSSSSKAFCPHPGLSLIQHESGTRDKLGTKGLLLPVSEKKNKKESIKVNFRNDDISHKHIFQSLFFSPQTFF